MVKALFPIGKTQWSKWNDEQKVAFNEASNQMKKKGFNPLKVLEDVVEVAAAVSGATAAVDTTVKLVKTVTKKKGK
jgi:hypothetical protein